VSLQPLLHLLPFLAAVRAAINPPGLLAIHCWPADDPTPEAFLAAALARINADSRRGVRFVASCMPGRTSRVCPMMPPVAWHQGAFRLSIPKLALISPLRRLAHLVGRQVCAVMRRLESAPPYAHVSQAVIVGGPCGGQVFRDEVRAFIEKKSSRGGRKRSGGRGAGVAGVAASSVEPAPAAAVASGAVAPTAAAPAAAPSAAGGVTVRVPSDGSIYVAAGAALYVALGHTDAQLEW
jgi:hypothetical protein